MAVLMHITGGGPARVPELMSIRYCNTANGGQRNVFVEDGLIVYVTRYHKGHGRNGSLKIIHRYLPQEVGELLMYYVWMVIPFERLLAYAAEGRDRPPEEHGFVWSPEGPAAAKWTASRFRGAIKRESKARMGVEINVATYRQCVQAIGNRFIKGDCFFDVSGAAGEEAEGEEGDGDAEGRSHTWDMQFGHSTRMAGAVYGRLMIEAAQELKTTMERYREASIRFHQFQQHASTLRQLRRGSKKRSAAAVAEDMDANFRRWKKVKIVDRRQMLRQLTG